MNTRSMSSQKPYMLRAIYEWLLDNDCTPHLLVAADHPQASVPQAFVEDGQIVLNLSPSAIRHLHMDNQAISFEGRFAGVVHQLYVPCGAVLALYARENGQGMGFELELEVVAEAPAGTSGPAPATPDDETPRPGGRPSLKVVK